MPGYLTIPRWLLGIPQRRCTMPRANEGREVRMRELWKGERGATAAEPCGDPLTRELAWTGKLPG